MANIYLLRHGESEWNASGNRYCGLTDICLSERGIKQAQAAAAYLKEIPFSAAYSSTLSRANETARIIMEPHGLVVQKDERIVEVDFGYWEGKTIEEFTAENPTSWAEWVNSPGSTQAGIVGENATQVYQRFHDFFKDIANKHHDENILVVAHSTANRLFIAGVLGMPFKNYRRLHQDNTGITIFNTHDEEFLFHTFNLNHHLKAL